ncbi:MAG: ABC transporter ATP-binding protein [Flavobacteriales bacterium]|nr:ABC transporter ATP-binding protein [Flavobacteriales bacterium]
MSDPIIRVEGLVKRYRKSAEPALNGVDLRVGAGEFLGMLGPNGAGKTTLISILTGVMRATAGSVAINGMDLFTEPGRVHRIIGLVPQEPALYESLSAWENLAFFGALQGLDGRAVRERGAELLERAGLSARAHDQVKEWSGGMKRRLNLMVALLHQPSILFLDEPTVGIDVQSRSAIWGLLQEIHAAGTTIVYTSHHLEEAERLCTRVVIMDHGRFVGEVADPRALTGHERLEEAFLRITGKALRD